MRYMQVLQAKQLQKSFQDGAQVTAVLKGIDMTVSEGEFVAITGASGAGKSTLVYQIGLLDVPTAGTVFVGDTDAASMSMRQKTSYRLETFGFVFQDYALLPEMRAWENVALPVLMRGTPLQSAKKQAVKALSRFGMADRINHTPSQLSGGESQRVSIARAIVHQPSVLFADEPTANLDGDRSRQVIDIFHELHRAGQTIVMVTHELEYAEEASRLIVLKDGVIEKDGRPKRSKQHAR